MPKGVYTTRKCSRFKVDTKCESVCKHVDCQNIPSTRSPSESANHDMELEELQDNQTVRQVFSIRSSTRELGMRGLYVDARTFCSRIDFPLDEWSALVVGVDFKGRAAGFKVETDAWVDSWKLAGSSGWFQCFGHMCSGSVSSGMLGIEGSNDIFSHCVLSRDD